MSRSALVSLLALLPLASSAKPESRSLLPTDPAPPLIDMSAQMKFLRVFSDGKERYVVFADNGRSIPSSYTFYGDRKVLYRQPARLGHRTADHFDLSFVDPRFRAPAENMLLIRGKAATYTCGERKIQLSELPAAAAKQLVAQAEYRDVYWRRRPHALARDSRGTYYYVDKFLAGDRRLPANQRVFVGPRQRMKLLAMKNIISDAAGELYITAGGQLRLQLDRTQSEPSWTATWIRGARKTRLTVVDLEHDDTVPMIYNDLGVYGGVKLQQPCDVF